MGLFYTIFTIFEYFYAGETKEKNLKVKSILFYFQQQTLVFTFLKLIQQVNDFSYTTNKNHMKTKFGSHHAFNFFNI